MALVWMESTDYIYLHKYEFYNIILYNNNNNKAISPN